MGLVHTTPSPSISVPLYATITQKISTKCQRNLELDYDEEDDRPNDRMEDLCDDDDIDDLDALTFVNATAVSRTEADGNDVTYNCREFGVGNELWMLAQYLVHWDGYQANLQAAFERQFLSESFVDVTLAVESGLIKCHKVVLCAASSYFQQLLSQHSCPHPIIFMRDMQYWEVIALVDFMYRGEVSVEEDKLEALMRAAQTLQVHGLSSCLKACLEKSNITQPELNDNEAEAEAEDSQEKLQIPSLEPQVQLSTVISKLCELNSELELRPITPAESTYRDRDRRGSNFPSLPLPLDREEVPTSQKNVVKEEIEFIEDRSQLSPAHLEPLIQIQSVFSEQSQPEEKTENSDDCIEVEDETHPTTPTASVSQAEPNFRQFLLVSPMSSAGGGGLPELTPMADFKPKFYQDMPLYKKYSPRVLEQALRDLQTGRFRSIRACARHHGIPMTTLRYRAKVHLKKPHWMAND
ncbi:uncharacterized protein LOC124355758 [Homalodisca vitripennis]|uniref:uncharacterized protein LOC124355758 n=1 Tax=Homalodisca vitripennis TaxID=197043 RepID=UPI001EEB4B25|nr:uncharacterized protein LOC124355758 [Homalodisca vitripennis]